jgi:hypothetical protein
MFDFLLPCSSSSASASSSGDVQDAVSAPNKPRPYPIYEHIPEPTFEDLRHAAYLFDQIAEYSSIEYVFGGRIGAVLGGKTCQIHGIEIVLTPSAMANNEARLTAMANARSEYFAVTPLNYFIIVIKDNKGVALQFHTKGMHGYPDFIPPYHESRLRTAEHRHLQPTFQLHSLGYSDDRQVPLLLSRVLLEQRISRFDPYTTNPDHIDQNQRDIEDIILYLTCTASDLDEEFTPHDSARLLPIVRTWIQYAELYSVLTSRDMVNEWRRLGLPLTEADISPRLRIIDHANLTSALTVQPTPMAWQFPVPGYPGYLVLVPQPPHVSIM